MSIMLVKAIGEVVVSIGIGAIVKNVVKATTPATVGLAKRVCIGVGVLALDFMITDAVMTYAEKTIGKVFAKVEETKHTQYGTKIYDLCEEEIHRM